MLSLKHLKQNKHLKQAKHHKQVKYLKQAKYLKEAKHLKGAKSSPVSQAPQASKVDWLIDQHNIDFPCDWRSVENTLSLALSGQRFSVTL